MAQIKNLYDRYTVSQGVSTDTRTLMPGQMYFALSGENFDGNAFAKDALQRGASTVVVSDRSIQGDEVVHVEDTLIVLQQLANYHRRQLKVPVLAITGSNGKTTTKELIAAVLAQKYHVSCTEGNFNNHIGVPLTLLKIPVDVEIAIVEMGANHVGEIAQLCEIAEPTEGLITNIGKAHLEGFGGIEGVKKGKGELYDYLARTCGKVYVNAGMEHLMEMSERIGEKVTYCVEGLSDKEDSTYRFETSGMDSGLKLTLKKPHGLPFDVYSPLYGPYNAQNIATAVTVGLEHGVSLEAIISAVGGYESDNNRSQKIERRGGHIFLDAYNANPTSMSLALAHFAELKSNRRTVILGGMNELGTHSRSEHRSLLDDVSQHNFDQIILVGEHFSELARSYPHFHWFPGTSELIGYLETNPIAPGDILVKGSRSNSLELLVDNIK